MRERCKQVIWKSFPDIDPETLDIPRVLTMELGTKKTVSYTDYQGFHQTWYKKCDVHGYMGNIFQACMFLQSTETHLQWSRPKTFWKITFFFGLTYPPCPYVQDHTIATLRLVPNVLIIILMFCIWWLFLSRLYPSPFYCRKQC